jgi:hypothetical protein
MSCECKYCGCQWSGEDSSCSMMAMLVHEKKSQGFLKDIRRRGGEDDQKILWGCADPTEGVWAEYFFKLDHQDKAKAFLKDVLQCGTKFEKQRQQKEDFLDWYEDWAHECPRCDEDVEERDRAWSKMGEDNPYYREWEEALVRPGGEWKPPEIHAFCDECGLFHADDAKWCHYYKIGEWCKDCAIPHDWRLPWPHP